MSYFIQAIISNENIVNKFLIDFTECKKIKLYQDLFIVPLEEDIMFDINNSDNYNEYGEFKYLTKRIEKYFKKLSGNNKLIYIEAEYFSGIGVQYAAFWENEKLISVFDYNPDSINHALKELGVVSKKNKDEFETVNLGKYRTVSGWNNN